MAGKNDSKNSKRLEALEDCMGYHFKSSELLEQALTHSSVRSVPGRDSHYERLEFLGDRVLGLCVSDELYRRYPEADEGELSIGLNSLVRGETLAGIADELNLHEFIRTGSDLKNITSKRMMSVRADVIEALIASLFLDGGLEPAQQFISRAWGSRFEDVSSLRRDSKTALQEWAHSRRLGTPIYREIERSGPDHEPMFVIEVKVSGKLASKGSGRSKRLAEQQAAKQMLLREGVWDDE